MTRAGSGPGLEQHGHLHDRLSLLGLLSVQRVRSLRQNRPDAVQLRRRRHRPPSLLIATRSVRTGRGSDRAIATIDVGWGGHCCHAESGGCNLSGCIVDLQLYTRRPRWRLPAGRLGSAFGEPRLRLASAQQALAQRLVLAAGPPPGRPMLPRYAHVRSLGPATDSRQTMTAVGSSCTARASACPARARRSATRAGVRSASSASPTSTAVRLRPSPSAR